jgi:hypothetical protein
MEECKNLQEKQLFSVGLIIKSMSMNESNQCLNELLYNLEKKKGMAGNKEDGYYLRNPLL